MSNTVNILALGNPDLATPMIPFHSDIISLLNDVSVALLKMPEAKAYPDIVTFAFFCRKANLEQLKKNCQNDDNRIGRGVAFHIAPSNVPVNFAYSLVTGLLAGNVNIVKASSKDFPQTRIICKAFEKQLVERYPHLQNYIQVVMYPREDTAQTAQFSQSCAVRIIWGGDATVQSIRALPLAPRAFDVTFADRYSILCIKADAVLQSPADSLVRLGKDFYNDTYLTDQNACTSPYLVYWIGSSDSIAAAQPLFWNAVHAEAKKRYQLEPILAVDKFCSACTAAIEMQAVLQPMPDNLVVRTQVTDLQRKIEENRAIGGYFIEYASETLDALAKIVTPRYQTLSQFGFTNEELRAWVIGQGLKGIDRVCPIGHTMDFSLTWDGYDLIHTLSRQIG